MAGVGGRQQLAAETGFGQPVGKATIALGVNYVVEHRRPGEVPETALQKMLRRQAPDHVTVALDAR